MHRGTLFGNDSREQWLGGDGGVKQGGREKQYGRMVWSWPLLKPLVFGLLELLRSFMTKGEILPVSGPRGVSSSWPKHMSTGCLWLFQSWVQRRAGTASERQVMQAEERGRQITPA